MDFSEDTVLGRTGLKVGRLGIGSGYWAPTEAIEEAFEQGCNYMTWGTVIKGYSPHMKDALRNIVSKGKRDRLVLAAFSYAHQSFITERLLMRGLRSADLDYADILVLGYYSQPPSERILDGAMRLKRRGLVRFLGVSSHNRPVFPRLLNDERLDIFHVRYNAAHRGAEDDVFPHLPAENRPGIVAFTATNKGALLNPQKMPAGETAPTADRCYRFVLSQPDIDVCMTAPRTLVQMRQNLALLPQEAMSEEERARMRRIGNHLYGRRS